MMGYSIFLFQFIKYLSDPSIALGKNAMIKRITFISSIAIFFFTSACSLFQNEENNNENETAEQKERAVLTHLDDQSSSEDVEGDELQLPNESLQKMNQGESVRLLQEVLIEIGYPIEATGTYDEYTTWAITDIQLQHDRNHATGIYHSGTKQIIKGIMVENKTINQGKELPKPQMEKQINEDGTIYVDNPYEILVLVNKQHALPADYIPHDLVIPNVRFPFTEDLPKKQLRQVAAEALEKLFEAGDQGGISLFAQSGYRSYDRQEAIFASNVNEHGEDAANHFSAKPGESERQSGLTMDVTSEDVGFRLVIAFEDTPEGKWIIENASKFGFIIRYPEGKEDITQYQYEPWHLRYVGKKAAKIITEENITLEEYLNID